MGSKTPQGRSPRSTVYCPATLHQVYILAITPKALNISMLSTTMLLCCIGTADTGRMPNPKLSGRESHHLCSAQGSSRSERARVASMGDQPGWISALSTSSYNLSQLASPGTPAAIRLRVSMSPEPPQITPMVIRAPLRARCSGVELL